MAHILIVDDDLEVLNTLSDAFVMFGHLVTPAQNGRQAWELFQANLFDVAIVDVEMPELNGLDLTREIKKLDPEFPVILITAYSHLYKPQDVLELDVEAFLKKPLNLPELVQIAERAAENRKRRELP